MDKWDERFLHLANEVRKWSKDPRTQVGAVLVSPDKTVVLPGYNGFPKGIADDHRLKYRDLKNKIVLHAEENAILNAKRDLTNWTIYCTQFPCSHCASVIIQSGIAEVIGLRPKYEDLWPTDLSTSLLTEASVNWEIH